MVAPPAGARILLAAKPVGFRKGAHGLAALAAEVLGTDPLSGPQDGARHPAEVGGSRARAGVRRRGPRGGRRGPAEGAGGLPRRAPRADRGLLETARAGPVVRTLMAAPGVGAIVAPTFKSTGRG
jgi:hypothetical protein